MQDKLHFLNKNSTFAILKYPLDTCTVLEDFNIVQSAILGFWEITKSCIQGKGHEEER